MEATQPVENPLSERIKATRKALGLSRVKAAKKWSISAATIQACTVSVIAHGQEPVFTQVWGKVANYADARKLAQLMLKDHRLPTLPGPEVAAGRPPVKPVGRHRVYGGML